MYNNTVPEFQADSIRELDGQDRGIDVDGVLVKDGRLYVNSLCLYGSKQEDPCAGLGSMVLCRSADRTTAHCVPTTLCTTFYDVGGGVDSGDGCYEFDAGRDSVSVSANTITSDKILDLSIRNEDIADNAVTSRNTDFTTLVLEDFGPVGRLTPNDWVYEDKCLDPDDLVLGLLDTEPACTETTAPTTNIWMTEGACITTGWHGMPIVLPEHTDETACESVTSDTGHIWNVEICLDTDDLSVASVVTISEGAECGDMFVAPGVRATLITSGVCMAADGTTIRDEFTTEVSCTTVTTGTGYEWNANNVCASTSDLVIESVTQPLNDVVVPVTNEDSCEIMAVASPNTWHTGWICLAPENQALLDITWLGGCEGTQILESLTLTNTGRAPDTSAEITGNTESEIKFKHQYQGQGEPVDSGIIAVGTEGHTPSLGTYMQLSTAGGLLAGEGEMQKRLRISSQGDMTIYGGVLRVEGDLERLPLHGVPLARAPSLVLVLVLAAGAVVRVVRRDPPPVVILRARSAGPRRVGGRRGRFAAQPCRHHGSFAAPQCRLLVCLPAAVADARQALLGGPATDALRHGFPPTLLGAGAAPHFQLHGVDGAVERVLLLLGPVGGRHHEFGLVGPFLLAVELAVRTHALHLRGLGLHTLENLRFFRSGRHFFFHAPLRLAIEVGLSLRRLLLLRRVQGRLCAECLEDVPNGRDGRDEGADRETVVGPKCQGRGRNCLRHHDRRDRGAFDDLQHDHKAGHNAPESEGDPFGCVP